MRECCQASIGTFLWFLHMGLDRCYLTNQITEIWSCDHHTTSHTLYFALSRTSRLLICTSSCRVTSVDIWVKREGRGGRGRDMGLIYNCVPNTCIPGVRSCKCKFTFCWHGTHPMQQMRTMEVNRVDSWCLPRVDPAFIEAITCTPSRPTQSRLLS